MASLLGRLNDSERTALLENLNYLNMKELREFCDAHGIPYAIFFETDNGSVRKSRDADRKGFAEANGRR
jgi:hypothetical protein